MANSVNLPGAVVPPPTISTTDIPSMLGSIFTWGVMIAAILAVVYIAIAGFQSMVTTSFTAKINLRARLWEIILGLVLALASVFILEQINPRLLTVSFRTFSGIGTDRDESLLKETPTLNRPEGGGGPTNDDPLLATMDGSEFTTSNTKLDTDGKTPPPFSDPHYQNQTSVPGLDANVDPYVVVPIDSRIPNGTRVRLTNTQTGKQIWAIVGDRGPAHGEISLAAARDLGVWREGMGNAIDQSVPIRFEFFYDTD